MKYDLRDYITAIKLSRQLMFRSCSRSSRSLKAHVQQYNQIQVYFSVLKMVGDGTSDITSK